MTVEASLDADSRNPMMWMGDLVRKILGSRVTVAVVVAFAVTTLVGGVTYAVASTSPPPNTYYACSFNGYVNPLFITVNKAPTCPRGQTVVSWNQTGTVGGTGPQGVPGPQGGIGGTGLQGVPGLPGGTGLQGPQGPQGGTGLQGLQGVPGGTGLPGKDGAVGGTGPAGKDGKDGATGGTGPAGSIVGSACAKGTAQGQIVETVDPTTGAVTFTCVVPTLVFSNALIGGNWGSLTGSGLQPGSSISGCDNFIPGCGTEGFVVAANGTVNTASNGGLFECGDASQEGNAYFTGTTQFGTSITSNEVVTPPC
jgi:hypothetical protein